MCIRDRAIGSRSPEIDVETMLVALTVYEELGLSNLNFKINSVGCPVCRPHYRKVLVDFLSNVKDQLSGESQKRLETNPMRILDSKSEKDIALTVNAPLMKDHLCEECSTHFEKVKALLTRLNIKFEIDGKLVRGLDYYTKTAYEIQSENLGSQNALGGGGRYDLLTESLGGKPTPAVGFAAGIERLIIVMEAEGLSFGNPAEADVYFVALGESALSAAMPHVHILRKMNLVCEIDYLGRSMKAQMRDANRQKAKFTIILGDNEIAKNECVVKNMENSEQSSVPLPQLDAYFQNLFAR